MKKLRVGLAGLGTVGKGVYDILQKDAKLISLRSQTKIEIVAVASRSKKDFLDPKIKFYPDVIALAFDPEIEVVVEVIGGCGIAKELLEEALKNGKKVVTANKALLAEHGLEIAKLVQKHNYSRASFYFFYKIRLLNLSRKALPPMSLRSFMQF